MNNSPLLSVSLVLLFVLVLLTVFGIVYLHITFKSKERLALIEKGMDPNLANNDFWTQVGIISGSGAFGLVAGDKIPGNYGVLIAIMFAGAAIVVYNILKRKGRRNKFQ